MFRWLTPAGLEQLKALAGEIIVDTFAQREFIKTGEQSKVKVANAAYVLQVSLRQRIIVDATLIPAPSSTKNKACKRNLCGYLGWIGGGDEAP